MAEVQRYPNDAKNVQYRDLTKKEKGGKKMSLFLAGTAALIQADMGGSQTSSQSGDKGIDPPNPVLGGRRSLRRRKRKINLRTPTRYLGDDADLKACMEAIKQKEAEKKKPAEDLQAASPEVVKKDS